MANHQVLHETHSAHNSLHPTLATLVTHRRPTKHMPTPNNEKASVVKASAMMNSRVSSTYLTQFKTRNEEYKSTILSKDKRETRIRKGSLATRYQSLVQKIGNSRHPLMVHVSEHQIADGCRRQLVGTGKNRTVTSSSRGSMAGNGKGKRFQPGHSYTEHFWRHCPCLATPE